MTHSFDISPEERAERVAATESPVNLLTAGWLWDIAATKYADTEFMRRIPDEKRYRPVADDDDAEAALFAIAWKHESSSLLRRFKVNATISLLTRFRGPVLLSGISRLTEEIKIYCGTDGEPKDTKLGWTTSPNVAASYALSNGYPEPTILQGSVSQKHVLMCLKDDLDSEIVVQPDAITLENCLSDPKYLRELVIDAPGYDLLVRFGKIEP